MKPRVVITSGDPAGIGPEIVRKALRDPRVNKACVPLLAEPAKARVPIGRPSRAAGLAAIADLETAVRLIQTGQAQAMVTAPVSKESFKLALYGFPGHTEWLAAQSGLRADAVGMLMVAGPMRTLLMTRHVPLVEVPRRLTPRLVVASAAQAELFLRQKAGIRRPRLVLCGINPHAGDHGLIGRDEQRIYPSAMRTLQRQGLAVVGPVAADAAFRRMAEGEFDLALAAYHDQGMIALKVHAPERMVNITVGLPYIRTSPAHGTAYDIAGRGRADARPMVEAILLAAQYA